ncbi:MAG TPA: glutamine amidotransferase [Anaeromyxobacteraceae bacterium]|nr:glutamine amidotransferase [Anaeromyxobacteraceae bacterium]
MESTSRAWRLIAASPWPTWALVLLGAVALASVLLAWRGLRTETRPRRRAVLVGLRAGSAVLAILLLLEPALQVVQTARVKNRLAVLVDVSRSMAFPTEAGGPSRASAAAEFIRDNRAALERLGDRVTLEWYAFSGDVTASDPATLGRAARADGATTDLLGALSSVAQGGSGRRLAGALIVSDGADHGALASGIDPAARERLRALGAPISTVATGRDAPRDVAVERIAVDEFAFVRNTITVEATVASRGFDGERVTVALRRDGATVTQKSVELREGRVTVPLSFAPDATGTFVLTVAAPVLPGEALSQNNARSFVLRVIRDRVRVLLVAGRPSWDERFLRGLLKQDPNVDLVSFYILRGVMDRAGPQDELSLIPFPVAEIFGEQLRTFDAVIFVNFAYQPYRSLDIERHLPAISEYVRNGGAFAMLGGEQSFGEGRYAATSLAEVLPVESLEGLGLAVEEFRPKLTSEGHRHPVTNLVAGDVANTAAWAALPPLPLLNRTRALPAASGSRVLLEAPSVVVAGRPAPLVAVREVGAGRTLAVTTDSSWFWGFLAAEQGGSTRAYQRFWTNALRWMVRDPELASVRVDPDTREADLGQPIGITVTASAPDWRPAAGAPVHIELIGEDGGTASQAEGTIGPDGTAHVRAPPPGTPGAFRVQASVATRCGPDAPCPPESPREKATAAVAVRTAGAEDLDVAPDAALLRELADATGGRALSAGDRLPELPLAAAEVVEVGRREDLPLWDRAWTLLALSLLVGAEWALRRRWGHA